MPDPLAQALEMLSRKDECIRTRTCVNCGEEVTGFDDQLSAREYAISGLCQKCQKDFFKEE